MSAERVKSMYAAVLLSALACPGAGQVYKRHYVRGSLLILATLVLLAAVAVKTWTAMVEVAMSTPPDQIFMDVMGIAQRIMQKESAFFGAAGYSLLAVWVYGVIDAALARPRPGKREAVD